MPAAPRPRMHGIDHVHGGPDVAMIVWEQLGTSPTVLALEQPPPEPEPDTEPAEDT